MSELKPCPFCPPDLSDPEFVAFNRSAFDRDLHWKVRCQTCGCECGVPESTKDDAAEVWNTRAERTCHEKWVDGSVSRTCVPVCSECGRSWHVAEQYCPSCGAKVVVE